MFVVYQILEKLLIIYFIGYLLSDIGLYLYSFIVFRLRLNKADDVEEVDFTGHSVSIIVPAYNEEVSVAYCTEMLLGLDYPDFELIIVNDGSSDNTIKALQASFELNEIEISTARDLQTAKIKRIYQSEKKPLIVIDKENGGKADSLNAGINAARGRYICTIDADSLLDEQALKTVIRPFVHDQDVMVTGGQLAASNGVHLENNRVISSQMPKNIWVLWQIIEYIKSFLIARIGLSKINALMLMSGAFSVYQKQDLHAVGGFLSSKNQHPYIEKHLGKGKQTVCEDMEIVVRLFRYRKDKQRKAKTMFLPDAVCWTEVPDKGKNLFRQRARWHQGLMESLFYHRAMIFEPRYKTAGLLGLPYYLFFEMLAPVIKVLALLVIVLAAVYNILDVQWVLLLLISVILLTAIITTSITAIIEYWSKKRSATSREALRYKSFVDWLILIFAGIFGEFSFSFFKMAAQLKGFYNIIRRKNDWMKFERKGVIKK